MKTTYLLTAVSAILCCANLLAQPVNDNCADAIPLTLGTTCNEVGYTSVGASDEGESVAPDPTCGFYQGGDVWFTFDVPASGNFRVDVSATQWTLYTGTCGNFTEFDCQSGAVNYRELSLAGQTLYLRAFRFNSDQGQDFSLCIWEYTPQPNDFCADAIELTLGSECTSESYSTTLSTAEDESVAPDPSCGFYQGGDTWFKFDVPASGNFRVDVSASQWTLYTGTCGSFTEFDCQSGAVNYREPGLAGQTLYLRAFRFNSDQGQDFSLCIWEYTPQPNDFCADAIELTVGSACILEAYSNTLSTAEDETVAPNPSCGFYQGGDTWFKFDAPASGDFRIEISGIQWVLYEGNCGNFTELSCESNPLNFSDPSLGGQTLYLRTFRFNSDQGSDFEACIYEIDPPANDMCDNAIFLPVSDECESLAYSSVFSTTQDESVADDPSCGFYQGGDVWFRFLAPESGSFTIEKVNASANLSMLTGSCGNFTEILCSSEALIEVNDPTLGGQIITLRLYRFNSRQGNDFELCIRADDVAPNDDCADAIALDVGSTCSFSPFHNRNATEEAGLAADPSCGTYLENDVWFTAVVPETGRLRADLSYFNNGPYTVVLYTGTCGNLTPLGCLINPNGSIAELGNLVGETIYLRVFRNGSAIGSDFAICLSFVDCNGDEGGTAFIDNCGDCVGGNTGEEECVPDCNGDFGGTAFIDNCGDCVGGNTGLEACVPDCNGDFGGTAFLDSCGDCVGGNTGLDPCCPVPFPALDENSLSTTVNPTNVDIAWASVLGQVGCQVQLRFEGSPSVLGSVILIGGDVDSFTIPGNVLQLNQDYEWRVRCGCSQTPFIVGPFSTWQPFSTSSSIRISASPNPTTDQAFVDFHSSVPDFATVEVYDMTGAKVAELYRGEIAADQPYRFAFDASGLPNGVYLCRYTGETQAEVVKILVGR